jgi:hypothetical protein
MKKIHKIISVIVLAAICTSVVYNQYKKDKEKHARLETTGLLAKITATHFVSWGVDYVNYYFFTAKGQRIEDTQKCGYEFMKYPNSLVIYNPTDSNEYEFLFDFKNYSPKKRIIFYFIMYLPIMSIVVSGWFIGIISVIIRLKERTK